MPVPREYVEALLPGIFALREQLQQQYQHAPNKASVDHSRMSLVDTLIVLAEAQLRVLPFRLQQFSGTYALLQLPQVRAILASPSWPSFQQQVLDSHSKVEQQRLSPWATLAPDLAGRLDQLVDSVGHLAEVVSQQQGNMQAGAAQQVPTGGSSRKQQHSTSLQQVLLQHSNHRRPQPGMPGARLAAARPRWCQLCTAARSRRWMMLSR